jgi:hypothetical protein
MATAGSIVIDLLLKSGSFETDTKRAAKNLDDLNKQAKIVGAAIGGAFVAGTAALAYFVKQSIDTMDEMSKLAQSTGTTVEAISSLAYAADLSGVSNQDLGSALSKLTKNMSDAAKGTGEAQAGFKALGISVTDANGNLKSSDAVLSEIADKFAGYKDGAEKTALAVNLFGRAGAQLIPLLNSGADGLAEMEAEAKRLGIAFDKDAAEAAEKFNDSLTRLNAVKKGFIDQVTAAALPAMNAFTQALIDATTKSDGLGESTGKLVHNSGLTDWVNDVAVGLARIADVAVFVAKSIDTVASSFAAVTADVKLALAASAKDNSGITEFLDPDAAKKQTDEYAAVLADRNKTVEDANKKLADLWNYQGNRFEQAVLKGINSPADAGTMPTIKTTAPAIVDPQAGARKAQIDDGQKLIDQLQKQIDLTGDLTERQKLQIQIQQGYVTFNTQSQALALADTLDFIKQQNDAYEQTQKTLKDLAKVNQDTTDDMGQFAVQAARNIQSSLGDGLYDILSGNFDNIGQSFANTILRMVADAESAQLAKALFGDYDKSGQIGGLIGGAVASIFGAGISSSQSGTLAGITNVGPATGDVSGLSYTSRPFADGGYTGPGGRNDVAGVVHAGEYVINAQSTRKLGMGFLGRLNGYADGGYVGNPPSSSGGPNVQVNVTNESGSPVAASQSTARFDGEKMVIDILLKDKRKNGPVSRAFAGAR